MIYAATAAVCASMLTVCAMRGDMLWAALFAFWVAIESYLAVEDLIDKRRR